MENNVIEQTMFTTFANEPKILPLTSRDCFKTFLKGKSISKNVDLKFDQLSKEHQDMLSRAAQSNVTKSKKFLKDFAASLSDEPARMYIGQNRLKFLKMFQGIDIFEKEYPISDYPPFKLITKTSKKKSDEDEAEVTIEDFVAEMTSVDETSSLFPPVASSTPFINKQHPSETSEDSDASSNSTTSDDQHVVNTSRYIDFGKKKHLRQLEVQADAGDEKESSSDDDSSSDGNEASTNQLPIHPRNIKTSPATAFPRKPAAATAAADSSESEDDSSDEDEHVLTKVKYESDDSEEDDLPSAWTGR